MWELDHRESWVPKSWYFWTVVLEKTLESPLVSKEIKPINPKGNQSCPSLNSHWKDWCCSGSSNIWPPDEKSQLIRKIPDTGKDWKQKKKGMTGWDGWMASSTQLTWVWASSGRWWWTGKVGMLQSMRSQRVRHDWVTEQQHQHWNFCLFTYVISFNSSNVSTLQINKAYYIWVRLSHLPQISWFINSRIEIKVRPVWNLNSELFWS